MRSVPALKQQQKVLTMGEWSVVVGGVLCVEFGFALMDGKEPDTLQSVAGYFIEPIGNDDRGQNRPFICWRLIPGKSSN